MRHGQLDEAVDDLAARWREEVRPFLAQRVHEEQSSAVFRILTRIREYRRIGIGVEYLDEQTITEMTHGEPYHAGVHAVGVRLCWRTGEPDRISDKLGDE